MAKYLPGHKEGDVHMGFKARRTVYKLVFDDPEMEGLVVSVRRGTIAERERYDEIETNEEIFEFFVDVINEWNVEDENDDVLPITVAGMKGLEVFTFQAIQDAWLKAGRAVPVPLEQPSSDGAQSLEASLPMEPVSPSLAS